MANAIWRVALIVGGAFLLVANFGGGQEGTFLALSPPDSMGRIGFDLAKLAIAALGVWFIYRGVRPRRN